jgi:hypothetical protein
MLQQGNPRGEGTRRGTGGRRLGKRKARESTMSGQMTELISRARAGDTPSRSKS